MSILSAREVATYLLVHQPEPGVGEPITNMKLQKLCYYAQGFALVKLQRPLFFEEIEHGPHGPVVPALWKEYKEFGRSPIPIPERPLDDGQFDSDIKGVLDEVINNHGSLNAWELRNKTHTEPPWRDTPADCPITHQELRAYFETVVESMGHNVRSDAHGVNDISLAARMVADEKFRELTERGLAELAAGQLSSWEEVRATLVDL
jgi:uncharacterized phage-associated protein